MPAVTRGPSRRFSARVWMAVGSGSGWHRAAGTVERQLDGESGALAGRAHHVDGAAVRRDDHLDDVQAETEPAIVPGRDAAAKALEDMRQLVGGDADAVIFDDEPG